MEMFKADNNMEEFLNSIEEFMSIPDEKLNEHTVDMVLGAFKGAFTPKVREEAILELMGQIKNESSFNINDWKKNYEDGITELLKSYGEISPLKEKLISEIFDLFVDLIEEAANRVGNYDTIVYFELVHPEAKMPTYAHDTDAGADIYAPEDITIPAGSTGMLVKTGLKMAMVNSNWALMIYPRSGLSMKTGLRISNNVGVVDSMYRDEIGILFDNISCEDYTIHAGDRIAQFILTPAHRFRARQIEDVATIGDNRNGGFGSTNK